jgi:hypothetical protein
MSKTEGEWAELVRGWRASRQSAREFARARGFSDAALRYWAGRLERRPAASRASLAETPMRVSKLARVVRPGELPPPQTAGAEVLVQIGKAAIAVRPGFDPALLRDVLRVLAEAG